MLFARPKAESYDLSICIYIEVTKGQMHCEIANGHHVSCKHKINKAPIYNSVSRELHLVPGKEQ